MSAPNVTVQARLPLLWRVMVPGGALFIAGAIAATVFGNVRSSLPAPAATAVTATPALSETEQVRAYREQAGQLRQELDKFSSMANAAESQLNIERSAQKQLMMQVKTLEADKVKLKEELAFFESLLPADASAQGISIRRLKADVIAPNQLRYQLLVMKGGKGDRLFTGNLQLVVTVIQGGKSAMISFADGKAGDGGKFKLAFKQYQRVEGVLTLPEGVTMKAVQARILENGQLRTQLSVNL